MKTILSILICGCCLNALSARAEIEQATVTLPYSELLGLLERAKPDVDKEAKAPSKPPVDVMAESSV
jgi:hypothetical protein